MTLPFSLPPISSEDSIPFWMGNGFQIGDKFTKVLEYSINNLGWNDDLTSFQEDSAGENHFIERASRDCAITQIKKCLKYKKNPVILEVGCLSGFMLDRLQEELPHATVMGSDVVFAPLVKLAEKYPSLPFFRFDLAQCPLPDASVDAVVMLNVLEHIEDDSTALSQVFRILKPGGTLILEVPAGPHLYDCYDKLYKHFRRYSLNNLCKLIKDKGFEIRKQSHLGFLLYPGFAYVKKKNLKHLDKSEIIQKQMTEKQIKNTGNSKIFHIIMQIEVLLGRIFSYPKGIRCVVACEKPVN